MTNALAIFLLWVITFSGSAQQLKKEVLANQGSSQYVNANLKSFYLLQTIGQKSLIYTIVKTKHSLRQGFLQPVPAPFLSTTANQNLDAVAYPNPVKAHITIKFSEPVYDLITFEVIDGQGRVLLSYQVAPQQQLQFDLSRISSGYYVLRLRMRARLFVTKILKR